MSSRRGVALIAVSSLFFAALAVLARTLADRVPATELVVVRHLIGLVAVGAYFVVRRKRPTFVRPGLLVLRGFFGGGAVLTYFYAIHALGAAPATVLNYISPVYAAVWAAIFLRERATPVLIAGLLLASAGAVLVTLATGDFTTLGAPSVGALAGIAAGLFGGAAMATVKAAREDADVATVFLAFSAVGLVMAAPFAATQWVPLEGSALGIAVLVGLLAVPGQLLWTWGIGFTTATVGSATTQLVPAIAWVFALTWLHESVSAMAVVGAVCCVAGVLVGMVPAPAARPARHQG